jgi:hypothetical protein
MLVYGILSRFITQQTESKNEKGFNYFSVIIDINFFNGWFKNPRNIKINNLSPNSTIACSGVFICCPSELRSSIFKNCANGCWFTVL